MRTLLIMCHAKSSWSDENLPDHDRPLNERGELSAVMMAGYLEVKNLSPDYVCMSSAKRSADTWAHMKKLLGEKIEAKKEKTLYMADPRTILDVIRAAPSNMERLLVIGHQPGMSALIRKLSDNDTPSKCMQAFRHFPTGSLAVLGFDVEEWSDIAYGTGQFTQFKTPKTLL